MYIKYEVSATLVIEKSKFICFLKDCETEEEYRSFLAETRKKYYDASHVCSAFLSGNIRRSSDDGEPSGTAGIPILNVLERNHLEHTCALVVRYFGGIKLGTGGLIRAYGNAVSEALKKAQLVEDAVFQKYSLETDYETAAKLSYWLEKETVLLETNYDIGVEFIFALDDVKKLEKIREFTRGKEPVHLGEQILQKDVIM